MAAGSSSEGKREDDIKGMRSEVLSLVGNCADFERLATIRKLLLSNEPSSISFLGQCRLFSYVKTFDKLGFTTVETLARMGDEELKDTLTNLAKMKPGHRVRLVRFLSEAREIMSKLEKESSDSSSRLSRSKSSPMKTRTINTATTEYASTGDPFDLWSFHVKGFKTHLGCNDRFVRSLDMQLNDQAVWTSPGKAFFLYYSKRFNNWRFGRTQDIETIRKGTDLAIASTNDDSSLRMVIENEKAVCWKEWSGRWSKTTLIVYRKKYLKKTHR